VQAKAQLEVLAAAKIAQQIQHPVRCDLSPTPLPQLMPQWHTMVPFASILFNMVETATEAVRSFASLRTTGGHQRAHVGTRGPNQPAADGADTSLVAQAPGANSPAGQPPGANTLPRA
jgi:hypothetical protein